MSKSKKKTTAADKQPTVLTEVRKLLAALDAELLKARIAPDVELNVDVDPEVELQPNVELEEGTEVYLYFGSFDGLNRFLEIVTKVEPGKNSLYRRILCSSESRDPAWSYEIYPVHSGREKYRVHLEYRVGVYFPVSDIPVVLGRLRDHNDSWESDARDAIAELKRLNT